MKTSFITTIALLFSLFMQAQTDNGTNLMNDAQSSLGKREYIKARYLYKQAYQAFAAEQKYDKAIECGFKSNALFIREGLYNIAIPFYNDMDQTITAGELRTKRNLSSLHFAIAKEKFNIYSSIKKKETAQECLSKMEAIALQSKNDSLNNELLLSKVCFNYHFGQISEGDNDFNVLLRGYKEKKQYDKINESYNRIIKAAKETNNEGIITHVYHNYIIWKDSVNTWSAQDNINKFKSQYNESLKTIKDKDSSLSAKTYMIIALCTLAAILIGGLIIITLMFLRIMTMNRRLKKNIQIANENNEQKNKFIQNFSLQMEPTANSLFSSAKDLETTAPKESMLMQNQIHALKEFSCDMQNFSTLESTIRDIYPMSEINVATFCEQVMDKVRPDIKEGVTPVVNAPKIPIKMNKDNMELILIHLLKNAAEYTDEGKIILDFKKRAAHKYEFIITDTGRGIPQEKQDNLFKPFSEVKDLTLGSGLGLPICSLIAAKMNGSISLEKTYKKGARFILAFNL